MFDSVISCVSVRAMSSLRAGFQGFASLLSIKAFRRPISLGMFFL